MESQDSEAKKDVGPPPTPAMGDVARGVSWIGAGHAISQVAWFGSLLYLAALLPPEAVGSVTIAMVFVQIAWMLQNAGTIGSIVTAPVLSARQIRRALLMTTVTGLGITLAVVALAGPILSLASPEADPTVLQVLALSIAVNGFSIVPLALLQKRLFFKRHAAANGGAAIIASAIAAGAGALGAGVWALTARQVLFKGLGAMLAWLFARKLIPRRAPASEAEPRHGRARLPNGGWFFLLTLTAFVAFNVDYVVVGRVTDVESLGLYSLAFTIAFAPVTQVAWQLGKVLLPTVAATPDTEMRARRAVKAVRMTALLFLPWVAPAVVLAPVVLPAMLGPEWRPMVVPFQVLVAVGALYGVLDILREFLVGSGHVAFCAKTDLTWFGFMTIALVALVAADGIRGAALTHAIMFVPLATAYVALGGRRVGVDAARLWAALRGVAMPVVAQAALTGAVVACLRAVDVAPAVAATTGAAAGLAILVLVLWRVDDSPLAEGRAIASAMRLRGA